MSRKTEKNEIEAGKRGFLTRFTAIGGLLTTAAWIKPSVNSVVLPAHANTSNPPVISNALAMGGCSGSGFAFDLSYTYTSAVGITSHVVTASCSPGDSIELLDDIPGPLGENLLTIENDNNSFRLTGDEFSGSVVLTDNDLEGTDPMQCALTITLTDENGGQTSEVVNLSENCFN